MQLWHIIAGIFIVAVAISAILATLYGTWL